MGSPHHDDEVMQVRGDEMNALIKSPGVNVDPFWLSLSEKSLAIVNIGSLICNVGACGSVLVAGAAPAGGPIPSTTAVPAEKEVEAKKNLRNLMMTWALVSLITLLL